MVKSSGKKKNYTVAELVAKAETLVDQCQPELAVKFFERALVKEPMNTALLDTIGELSTELNNPERALEAFQKSISIAPAQNPAKWFYVAQLVAGEDAERYSLQGIQYLLQEFQQLDPQVRHCVQTCSCAWSIALTRVCTNAVAAIARANGCVRAVERRADREEAAL